MCKTGIGKVFQMQRGRAMCLRQTNTARLVLDRPAATAPNRTTVAATNGAKVCWNGVIVWVDNELMRVLVGRGGGLVAPFSFCDRPDCGCGEGWASLGGGCLVEVATVADRDDVCLPGLTAAVHGYLEQTGWDKAGADLVAEIAAYMADDTAAIAADYPIGTRLRATFDRCADSWIFTSEPPVPQRFPW
jgi:hypothetical protein